VNPKGNNPAAVNPTTLPATIAMSSGKSQRLNRVGQEDRRARAPSKMSAVHPTKSHNVVMDCSGWLAGFHPDDDQQER